jgi:hypothetical protein
MEVIGQPDVPAALPSGKEPLVPTGGWVGPEQSRSGRVGEQKNPSPCREPNAGRPVHNLATIQFSQLRRN